MTVVGAPATPVQAIGARRQAQHHLDHLKGQIAARSGRRALAAEIGTRMPRRYQPRPAPLDEASFQGRFKHLTF